MEKLRIFLAVLLTMTVQVLVAQDETVKHPNNKVSINGREYYLHIVRKGETLSAISRAYEVPVDTIIADNPQLTYQIHPDQYINIRVKKEEKQPENYNYHLITKGDTPYNIAKRYGISIDELYRNNPGAELGIKIGDRLKIKAESKAEDKVEVAESKDTTFMLHQVKKQETLYGIARMYQTTPAEIETLNPEIVGRSIQVDEMLKVPIKKEVAEEVIEGDFDFHKVEKQETLYGIARAYQINEKALLKINPSLKKRELQEGELIRVPKGATKAAEKEAPVVEEKPAEPTISAEEQNRIDAYEADNRIMHTVQDAQFDKSKTYKVALFLPLYLSMNDTTGWGTHTGKIYAKSKNYIEFYAGSMLAINELRKQGLSFDVEVVDTKGDSLYISNYMRNHDMSGYDMFIGPAFSGELQVVGDYAWEHQINIVSPLSVKSTFIDHNPYAFQVCPTLDIQMKYMAEFLNQIDTKNFIVIHNGDAQEQDFISEFKRQLYSSIHSDNFDQVRYNEYYYYTCGDILNSAFIKGKDNIVIIPSTDRAFVTDVMGKLNGYSYEYKVTLFGQPRWERFESIDIDYFHNTNTHYLSNSYIDYSKPEIIDFVRNYRNLLSVEPDRMAFQGYDITMFFCTALNKFAHDFRRFIMYHTAPLLQTEFNFVPYSDQGGYQNTSVYILDYAKDYTIKKIATYPEK
ncbi:MAG: LysM peptidoglycan-binding domain-containing protein [Salinivirgaceae bacterium]|nr:LysM peptidoglycan-binding domain-containing protein [Salinivirgaceae bacterium]